MDINSELEGDFDMDTLNKYQHNPMRAAKEALNDLEKKSFIHLDMKLRHLALLLPSKEIGVWKFKPILIYQAGIEREGKFE